MPSSRRFVEEDKYKEGANAYDNSEEGKSKLNEMEDMLDEMEKIEDNMEMDVELLPKDMQESFKRKRGGRISHYTREKNREKNEKLQKKKNRFKLRKK